MVIFFPLYYIHFPLKTEKSIFTLSFTLFSTKDETVEVEAYLTQKAEFVIQIFSEISAVN
jgi:hypothetical protein